jgi:hypothetical protein
VNDVRYRDEVTTAVSHLSIVARQQNELKLNNSNGGLGGFIETNKENIRQLVLSDSAYRDAAAILWADLKATAS